MNTSLSTFLTAYKAELEASNKRFNDLMFRRALNAKIDLSCIDRIMQGIEDDQPRFNKWCEIMAKRKQDEEDQICCVCYECEADQPLKCSHKLCPTCYDKLTQCPLCRKCYKEPVDEREVWVRAFLANIERVQGLMDENDEWYQRPVDVFLTNRNNCFRVCFRSPAIAQEWLHNRGIVNYGQPGSRNMIELESIDEVIDLMQLMVQLGRRFEMILSHPIHRVVVTNQDNGRFKADCTTLRHAWNLKNYIGVGRCRYCGSGHQNLVIDIPCLFELMSFLSLPTHIQVQEPY
jgi:hypothetical protein